MSENSTKVFEIADETKKEKEEMAYATATYASFTSADMAVIVNGNPIGEAFNVDWLELFNTDPMKDKISGQIDCFYFGSDAIRKHLKFYNYNEVNIIYRTELGSWASIEFKNVTFNQRSMKHDIEDLSITGPVERYMFTAKSIEQRYGQDDFPEDLKVYKDEQPSDLG